MKIPALISFSSSLGDLLSVTPTLKKLYYTHKQRIVTVSYIPSLFKNNPYCLENLNINDVDVSELEKKYTVYKTFHTVGKKDPLGVEFKHAMCDIRQFHAKDLGFMLTPEEMRCDFFPEEKTSCMKKIQLPEKYIVLHPAQTWDSRTWEKEKWQSLIDSLNAQDLFVVTIGKDSAEYSDHLNQEKPAWALSIKKGIDLTNKTSLDQSWHIINDAECVVTMDSGILHLSGTTDTHIIQLGSSINPRFRAPYRYGSQDYKYSYVSGACQIHCASDLYYSLRDWGTIQSVTLINTCLENKPSFECKPSVEKVLQEVLSVISNTKKEDVQVKFPSPDYQKIINTEVEYLDEKKEYSQEILVSFVKGPKVEINGDNDDDRTFEVFFIDDNNEEIVYETQMKINHWCQASRKWFTNWRVEVWCEGIIIKTEKLNLRGEKVLISLSSSALGDTIAWSPYCLEFKNIHGCELIVESFHHNILAKCYDEVEFVEMNKFQGKNINFYATYNIAYGVDKEKFNLEMKKININFSKGIGPLFSSNIKVWNEASNPRDTTKITLASVVSDILGLDYREIRPNIPKEENKERPIEKKFVCISEFASAPGLKLWNNQIGWQKVVDHLNSLGFQVVSISMEKTNLKNVIKRNGKIDLEDRIWYLHHCEFFIGVSSGLSWLAWACGKKVVMISGATKEWNEFQEDNIRIINKNFCNGCWNSDEHSQKFGCFHYSLCPENKNFECTRKISPQEVINSMELNNLLN